MAHTSQAAVVTDQDTIPATKVDRLEQGGDTRTSYGFITSVAASTAGQSHAFVRVPVTAKINHVKIFKASQGNGSVKVGFYRPNDGIEVDSDALTAAYNLGTASGGGTSVVDAVTPANYGLPISTAHATAIGTAGATEDTHLDICVTVVTATTGAATAVGLEVAYTTPN